jgi:putative transposase
MTNGNKNHHLKRKKKYQKKFNCGVYNTGHFGRIFAELLTYKAQPLGKRVIPIDERYITKTCCVCDSKKETMCLSDWTFRCEIFRTVIDCDKNSVINILRRFLSQHALWMNYQYFLEKMANIDNLRYTVDSKTRVSYYPKDKRFGGLVGSHLF